MTEVEYVVTFAMYAGFASAAAWCNGWTRERGIQGSRWVWYREDSRAALMVWLPGMIVFWGFVMFVNHIA